MNLRNSVSRIKNSILYGEIEYVPRVHMPVTTIKNSESRAWYGIESIIPDVISRFGVGTMSALEFGVEYGY